VVVHHLQYTGRRSGRLARSLRTETLPRPGVQG
jgi:hypothetical protein